MASSTSIKLVGVGNRYRRDDGVGPAVIDQLETHLPTAMLAVSDGEINALLGYFETCAHVCLIDAIDGRGESSKPGEIVRIELDAKREAFPLKRNDLRSSSHAMGVSEAIEMARVLDKLPQRLTLIGVVSEDFSNEPGLSSPVQETANRLVKQLSDEFGIHSGK